MRPQDSTSPGWGDLAARDEGSKIRHEDPHEGHTAAFYWVQRQSLEQATGRQLGKKIHPNSGMESFTEVKSVTSEGAGFESWILHQAYPEVHDHAVLLYGRDGDEDLTRGTPDSEQPEIRHAAAVQRRYHIKIRYMAADRLLAISAPSDIAKRVAADLVDAGIMIAKPVEIDLRKLNEHDSIKDTVAAWADGSDHIRTRAAFGSKVLTDKRGLSGDLRSIRVLIDLGHVVRGVMISRDGRLTILGHDGTLETLIALFRDLKPLIGTAPPAQRAL